MQEGWVNLESNFFMNEVDALLGSVETAPVIYVNFLESYNRNDCYAFVEGDDDYLFYHSQFQKCSLRPTKIFVCGGKKKVKECYAYFDWNRFSKKQIVFLIDKDLSDVVKDENDFSDNNVYKTPLYAIENVIASDNNFANTLATLGFYNLKDNQLNKLKADFNFEKNVFEQKMTLVMSIIVCWRKNGTKPANYNNINVKDFCRISLDNHVSFLSDSKIVENVYNSSQVEISLFDANQVCAIQSQIINDISRHLRGKYIVPIYISYCNSIASRHHIKQHPEKLQDPVLSTIICKGKGLLQESDFYRVLSTMCPVLPCLKIFLDNTINQYTL